MHFYVFVVFLIQTRFFNRSSITGGTLLGHAAFCFTGSDNGLIIQNHGIIVLIRCRKVCNRLFLKRCPTCVEFGGIGGFTHQRTGRCLGLFARCSCILGFAVATGAAALSRTNIKLIGPLINRLAPVMSVIFTRIEHFITSHSACFDTVLIGVHTGHRQMCTFRNHHLGFRPHRHKSKVYHQCQHQSKTFYFLHR